MDKAEIRQISNFLDDVLDSICEGNNDVALQLHLVELHHVIKRLMDAMCATDD